VCAGTIATVVTTYDDMGRLTSKYHLVKPHQFQKFVPPHESISDEVTPRRANDDGATRLLRLDNQGTGRESPAPKARCSFAQSPRTCPLHTHEMNCTSRCQKETSHAHGDNLPSNTVVGQAIIQVTFGRAAPPADPYQPDSARWAP
jgi:hypothetical protein